MIHSHFSAARAVGTCLLLSLAVACSSADSDDAADDGAAGSGRSAAGSSATAGSKATAGDTSASGGKSGASGTSAAKAGAGARDAGSVAQNPAAEPDPVELGAAADYVILAMSGVSTVPTSAVTGNLGVSPAAASYITGFSLTVDSTNVFATSTQVTGKVSAADYAAPTPAGLTAAVGDMLLAFTDAAGRAPDVTELGAGDIGGMTLERGVYKWSTGLLIPKRVTLSGSKTDVWIFQIAQDLTISSGAKVVLSGGALAKNVFWQVAGLVDIGTTAHCEGTVLTQTSATLATGASLNGRLLAQTAVDIDGSTVVAPQ